MVLRNVFRCLPSSFLVTALLGGGMLSSCTGLSWAPAPAPIPPASIPASYPPVAVPAPSASAGTVKLRLFGGDAHGVYLGCLNCSEYAADSVMNKYGAHGSPYSQESVHNHYSQYGSPYATTSACNRYANDPPVIVDAAGNYYGRLTLNQFHAEIGVGRNFIAWLSAACQN